MNAHELYARLENMHHAAQEEARHYGRQLATAQKRVDVFDELLRAMLLANPEFNPQRAAAYVSERANQKGCEAPSQSCPSTGMVLAFVPWALFDFNRQTNFAAPNGPTSPPSMPPPYTSGVMYL